MQITYTNSISGQQHNHDKMTATFYELFKCAFESHISEVILKAKARTEERIDKYVADTYSKLQTQLIKDKFKEYINK